jgi:6,7-dimethyl-8-ribityllumazine synthase
LHGSSIGDHAPATGEAFTAHGVTAEQAPLAAGGSRWGIVVARFNGAVTSALHASAVETLLANGAQPERITSISVPGALELPLAAHELAQTSHFAGIIALGCVIRGETAHFEHVCRGSIDGLLDVQRAHSIAVGIGVITCDTRAHADARASLAPGGHNVGADAARAAIELASLARLVRSS